MRKVLLGALLASGAVVTGGCNSGLGAPSSPMVEAQVDYNMVVADDRAKFREQDMTYQGSVGPYAVYKITGPSPRLVGPYVKAPAGFGYAMACGATHYFSVKTAANSALAGMQLRGGHSGAMVLVDVPQMPLDQGGCTTPKDTFGNPVPDGGTGGAGGTGGGGEGGTGGGGEGGTGGGGEGGGGGTVGGSPGGGTGTTGGGPIGDNGPPGGLGGGATPGDGSGGDTGVQQIGLTVSPPPPMGSTILVRRVALTAAQSHNGSHIEPNICCTDNVCSLQ
ncbi:MAG TPA: hypothetical protein VN947_27595 [Polyangia bacterium]|nr:hypothetical protein [Polyangia bacterium]